MEENETFEERRKKFSGGLGLLTSSECPGKADYVEGMITTNRSKPRENMDIAQVNAREIAKNRSNY